MTDTQLERIARELEITLRSVDPENHWRLTLAALKSVRDGATGPLVALLTAYFQQSFPSYPPTDPLEMVRLMGSILVQTNREKTWSP